MRKINFIVESKFPCLYGESGNVFEFDDSITDEEIDEKLSEYVSRFIKSSWIDLTEPEDREQILAWGSFADCPKCKNSFCDKSIMLYSDRILEIKLECDGCGYKLLLETCISDTTHKDIFDLMDEVEGVCDSAIAEHHYNTTEKECIE